MSKLTHWILSSWWPLCIFERVMGWCYSRFLIIWVTISENVKVSEDVTKLYFTKETRGGKKQGYIWSPASLTRILVLSIFTVTGHQSLLCQLVSSDFQSSLAIRHVPGRVVQTHIWKAVFSGLSMFKCSSELEYFPV